MSEIKFAPNEGIRDSARNLIYGINIKSTILTQAITVKTSATALPTTALSRRMVLLIQNVGANDIYIGASTVTTANGFKLIPNAVLQLSIQDDVTVYGIASANTNVRILEGA